MARVLTRSGTLGRRCTALPMLAAGARRVAVIVEPAHPARISPLLMSAYGLTEREQELTRLVLQGYSTAEIAARLVISAHTVQQHLKTVFDKTGVRSRRELVTQGLLRALRAAAARQRAAYRQGVAVPRRSDGVGTGMARWPGCSCSDPGTAAPHPRPFPTPRTLTQQQPKEKAIMGKRARKKKARKKGSANHGKRPNS